MILQKRVCTNGVSAVYQVQGGFQERTRLVGESFSAWRETTYVERELLARGWVEMRQEHTHG